ncbi:MAG: hypothetical protein CMA10_07055 [Euryarchaeota archaeon]|nr:hypothetical protein [Euryarchaeota archaeon]
MCGANIYHPVTPVKGMNEGRLQCIFYPKGSSNNGSREWNARTKDFIAQPDNQKTFKSWGCILLPIYGDERPAVKKAGKDYYLYKYP